MIIAATGKAYTEALIKTNPTLLAAYLSRRKPYDEKIGSGQELLPEEKAKYDAVLQFYPAQHPMELFEKLYLGQPLTKEDAAELDAYIEFYPYTEPIELFKRQRLGTLTDPERKTLEDYIRAKDEYENTTRPKLETSNLELLQLRQEHAGEEGSARQHDRAAQRTEAIARDSSVFSNLQLIELVPTLSKDYQDYYEITPPAGDWKEIWILENTKNQVVYTFYASVPEEIKKQLGIKINQRDDTETENITTSEILHLGAEVKKVSNQTKGTPQVILDLWRFVPSFV